MIRIAFIKYGGMASSGTEKFLQNVAMLLPKDQFEVDYYYCDATPYIGSSFKHPNTDLLNIEPMQMAGVNLVKFNVQAKDVTKKEHPWINTNFFEVFKNNYDLIQTGRAGNPEFPFTKIRKVPIVDSIHVMGGIDNQYNISRVMHITKWSAQKWIEKGGDKNRVRIVSHPMIICEGNSKSFRERLGLEGKIVFGFHQRNSDEIFSDIPLSAYKNIEDKNNHFIILGGSSLYQKQAQSLNIKNITFLPHTGDKEIIYSFLKTIDIYSHGRKDGEINSTAMAEAMFFGKPIISHVSPINNGHIECIGAAGIVAESLEAYINAMQSLQNNKIYEYRSNEARAQFAKMYDPTTQINNIINIYKEILSEPYPNKTARLISSLRIKFYLYKIREKITK